MASQSELLTDLSSQLEELSVLVQRLLQERASASDVPAGLLSPEQACKYLGYPSGKSLVETLRASTCPYQSGTEIQKHGRYWRINVRAIMIRLEKEQALKRVC
ncbi:MAG: hypothetical protein AAFV72_00020 [Cyanobacteria bacterium J06635_1]